MPAGNALESATKQVNRTFRLVNILLFLSVTGNIAAYIYGVWQSPPLSVLFETLSFHPLSAWGSFSVEVLVLVLWYFATRDRWQS